MTTCDVYHGGLTPPLANIDLGRRVRVVGIPGAVRFLCEGCARGRVYPLSRYRMIPPPDSTGGPFPRPLYPSIEAPTDEPVAPLGLAGKGGRLYRLAERQSQPVLPLAEE